MDLAHTPIRFITLFPGFADTDGLDPDDVPIKPLIISRERAVREMARIIRRARR